MPHLSSKVICFILLLWLTLGASQHWFAMPTRSPQLLPPTQPGDVLWLHQVQSCASMWHYLSVMKMACWHMHTEHTKTHKRSYWLTTSMPLSFLILYQHAWSTSRLLQVVAFLGWNGRRRLEPQGYSQALAFEEMVHAGNLQDGDVATLLVIQEHSGKPHWHPTTCLIVVPWIQETPVSCGSDTPPVYFESWSLFWLAACVKRHSSGQWLSPAKRWSENVNASHGCFQSPQNHTKSMYNISFTNTYTIIAYKLKNNHWIHDTLNYTSCCRHLKTPSRLLTIQKLTKQNPIYVETICRRSAHSLLPVLCKSTRNVGSVKTWFNMVQRNPIKSGFCTTLTAPAFRSHLRRFNPQTQTQSSLSSLSLTTSFNALPSTLTPRLSKARWFRAPQTTGKPPSVSVRIKCMEYLRLSLVGLPWVETTHGLIANRNFFDKVRLTRAQCQCPSPIRLYSCSCCLKAPRFETKKNGPKSSPVSCPNLGSRLNPSMHQSHQGAGKVASKWEYTVSRVMAGQGLPEPWCKDWRLSWYIMALFQWISGR